MVLWVLQLAGSMNALINWTSILVTDLPLQCKMWHFCVHGFRVHPCACTHTLHTPQEALLLFSFLWGFCVFVVFFFTAVINNWLCLQISAHHLWQSLWLLKKKAWGTSGFALGQSNRFGCAVPWSPAHLRRLMLSVSWPHNGYLAVSGCVGRGRGKNWTLGSSEASHSACLAQPRCWTVEGPNLLPFSLRGWLLICVHRQPRA